MVKGDIEAGKFGASTKALIDNILNKVN